MLILLLASISFFLATLTNGINKIDAVKLVIITDMTCEPIHDDKNWK